MAHLAQHRVHKSIKLYFCRAAFPKFWNDLEVELEEHADDLLTVKSILTAMGFMTKISIIGLKSAKNVTELGLQYTEMCASKDGSEILKEYQALKDVKNFSAGTKSMIQQIVYHLKNTSKPSKPKKAKVNCVEVIETIHQKMFEQAKKVCYFLYFFFSYLFLFFPSSK